MKINADPVMDMRGCWVSTSWWRHGHHAAIGTVAASGSLGASTVSPMFLAVPSMMRMAASTFVQLRSGSLVSAISCRQYMLDV